MVNIKKLKVIRHSDFEADVQYRLGSIEIKLKEIIDFLNELDNSEDV